MGSIKVTIWWDCVGKFTSFCFCWSRKKKKKPSWPHFIWILKEKTSQVPSIWELFLKCNVWKLSVRAVLFSALQKTKKMNLIRKDKTAKKSLILDFSSLEILVLLVLTTWSGCTELSDPAWKTEDFNGSFMWLYYVLPFSSFIFFQSK